MCAPLQCLPPLTLVYTINTTLTPPIHAHTLLYPHSPPMQALGEPLADATQGEGAKSMQWARTFKSGAKVTVDIGMHTAQIEWM